MGNDGAPAPLSIDPSPGNEFPARAKRGVAAVSAQPAGPVLRAFTPAGRASAEKTDPVAPLLLGPVECLVGFGDQRVRIAGPVGRTDCDADADRHPRRDARLRMRQGQGAHRLAKALRHLLLARTVPQAALDLSVEPEPAKTPPPASPRPVVFVFFFFFFVFFVFFYFYFYCFF